MAFPTGLNVGDEWTSAAGVLYVWNGTGLVIKGGGSAPAPVATSWTTATRPNPASLGQHGLNTTTNQFEVWTGTDWKPAGGSGSGLGAYDWFLSENQ